MHLSLYEQWMLFQYSLFVGLFMGVVYDVVRTVRAVIFIIAEGFFGSFKHYIKTSFQIFLDIIYCALYMVTAMIFIFGANDGDVRGFILLFSLVGTVIYLYTVGRFTKKLTDIISKAAVNAIYKTLRAVDRILKPVIRGINSAFAKRRIRKLLYKKDRK